MADQNRFWLAKCSNWSKNGQWPTVISSNVIIIIVLHFVFIIIVLHFVFLPVDDYPEEKYLHEHVVKEMCVAGGDKWRDLGMALMGPDAVRILDAIRIDYPDDVEECWSRMLTEWHQRTPGASWKQLISALREVKLTIPACRLEEKIDSGIWLKRLGIKLGVELTSEWQIINWCNYIKFYV